VDNSSSYPPLLDWYETIRKNPDVHIVKLGENLGPHVIYNRLSFFKEKYHEITGHQLPDEFIITDCDLDISAVPDDGLKILYQLREEDRKSERPHLKIGFGLRLDDLPNDPLLRRTKIWEPQLYKNSATLAGIAVHLDSLIDTTLHLLTAPMPARIRFGPSIRTAPPYQARHVPWYWTRNNLNEEAKYYLQHIDPKLTTHSRSLRNMLRDILETG